MNKCKFKCKIKKVIAYTLVVFLARQGHFIYFIHKGNSKCLSSKRIKIIKIITTDANNIMHKM